MNVFGIVLLCVIGVYLWFGLVVATGQNYLFLKDDLSSKIRRSTEDRKLIYRRAYLIFGWPHFMIKGWPDDRFFDRPAEFRLHQLFRSRCKQH
jgi:hypothetical protein